LDEIKDEIQQEKIQNFWKENGTFLVVGVILVIAIVGGRSWWMAHEISRDSDRTAALVSALNTNALDTHVEEAEGAHATIAGLMAAGTMDPADAVARYEQIAENGEDIYADMARLMAVGIKAEHHLETPQALIEELEPLTTGGAYQASALELKAFLQADQGLYEEAISSLNEIQDLPAAASFEGRTSILKQYYETRMREDG